jgi:hypothetical protein
VPVLKFNSTWPSRRAHFSIDIVELGLDDRLQLSATRERLGAQTVDHW